MPKKVELFYDKLEFFGKLRIFRRLDFLDLIFFACLNFLEKFHFEKLSNAENQENSIKAFKKGFQLP